MSQCRCEPSSREDEARQQKGLSKEWTPQSCHPSQERRAGQRAEASSQGLHDTQVHLVSLILCLDFVCLSPCVWTLLLQPVQLLTLQSSWIQAHTWVLTNSCIVVKQAAPQWRPLHAHAE